MVEMSRYASNMPSMCKNPARRVQSVRQGHQSPGSGSCWVTASPCNQNNASTQSPNRDSTTRLCHRSCMSAMLKSSIIARFVLSASGCLQYHLDVMSGRLLPNMARFLIPTLLQSTDLRVLLPTPEFSRRPQDAWQCFLPASYKISGLSTFQRARRIPLQGLALAT